VFKCVLKSCFVWCVFYGFDVIKIIILLYFMKSIMYSLFLISI
jgi:hypothetical protein